jgi:hypothetical protein
VKGSATIGFGGPGGPELPVPWALGLSASRNNNNSPRKQWRSPSNASALKLLPIVLSKRSRMPWSVISRHARSMLTA